MNAFIGQYLPKMLEMPLCKGLKAREVCAKHLPYTSLIPPIHLPCTSHTPPLYLPYPSLVPPIHLPYTSRIETPLDKGIQEGNGRYLHFYTI